MPVTGALLVVLLLVWMVCSVFILVHAFQRSIGTGFMVLCIPCYILYYAFAQFEHPRKNLIIAGFFGGAVLAGALVAVFAPHPGAEMAAGLQ